MSNPKYNPQKDHTREKLRIFSAYLDRCLSIMLGGFPAMRIYDMFAGQGKYEGSSGSAVYAAQIVREHRDKTGKDVRLHLNESDPVKFDMLCKHVNVEESGNWLQCTKKDANEAVNECLSSSSRVPQLFYLDPFGYSQIRKATMDQICGARKTECLLFVPVSHIARFARKAYNDESVAALFNFLKDYDINPNNENATKAKDWLRIIKNAFVRAYPGRYVGLAELASGPNYYGLYFVCNHLKGLEKFLEIVQWVKEQRGLQLNLFSAEEPEILSYLSEWRTNNEIYEWMLQQGRDGKQARALLLELNNKGKITVSTCDGTKWKKGSFYLSYKYYEASPKIKVKSDHVGN